MTHGGPICTRNIEGRSAMAGSRRKLEEFMGTPAARSLTTVLAEVDRDAADDGVSRRAAHAVLWLPAVGAVVVAATLLHQPLFTFLVQEDGPLEWAQFAGFLTAAVGFGIASWRIARRGDYLGAVLIGLGALMVFGIAGEEISWGQRIFGLETPAELARINHQDELNIHNITAFPMQRIGNYLQLVLGAAGLVLPWLTRIRRPVLHVRALRLLSPPLFVTLCFGILFGYRAVRFLWASSVNIGPVVTFGEWPELCFAIGLFAYSVVLVAGLRQNRWTGAAAAVLRRQEPGHVGAEHAGPAPA
jgi:hypothetical protein